MRINEIASAEEQIELWKLVSNNMWQALQQQQYEEQKRKAEATAKKKATRKLKGGVRSVHPTPSPPPPPQPSPNKAPQPPADKVGTASVATLATGPAQRVSAQQQASALQEPLNSVETADKAQRYKLQNMDDDTDDRHSKNTFSVSKRR